MSVQELETSSGLTDEEIVAKFDELVTETTEEEVIEALSEDEAEGSITYEGGEMVDYEITETETEEEEDESETDK